MLKSHISISDSRVCVLQCCSGPASLLNWTNGLNNFKWDCFQGLLCSVGMDILREWNRKWVKRIFCILRNAEISASFENIPGYLQGSLRIIVFGNPFLSGARLLWETWSKYHDPQISAIYDFKRPGPVSKPRVPATNYNKTVFFVKLKIYEYSSTNQKQVLIYISHQTFAFSWTRDSDLKPPTFAPIFVGCSAEGSTARLLTFFSMTMSSCLNWYQAPAVVAIIVDRVICLWFMRPL